jgi:putative membrane protein
LAILLCVTIGVIQIDGSWWNAFIFAILLAAINAVLKPFIIIFTLPIIAFTLGFFLIVINGILIYILSLVYGPINISNLWYAIVAGIVVGLLNYIVTIMYERLMKQE